MGRIRLEVIPDVQMETLEKGVEALVEPGSKVVTDGWAGYNSLEKNGYRRSIEIASREELADIALPNCHMVASLMKRWILGTLQGSVGAEHLQDYLNEFTFRFNRTTTRSRGSATRCALHGEGRASARPQWKRMPMGGGTTTESTLFPNPL